ncbi:MAG: AGE family epimerase/isomerase [Mangrovibacterium sp.]
MIQETIQINERLERVALLEDLYKDTLLNNVIPWWMEKSIDEEYGGFYTCLDREGNVYDTDKFVWLQCREVWTFSMLYNCIEKKQEWLDIAINGAEFLMKHGKDDRGYWYFSLNRSGQALVQPYNIFSDCFAAMAFGQLYKACGVEEYGELSLTTFRNILKRKDNHKGKYNKIYPGTRPSKSFALPMILSNLVLEIEELLDPKEVEDTIKECIYEVMDVFYKPNYGVIFEHLNMDGSVQDSFEGRLINPGHGLEAMWFVMNLAKRNNDQTTIQKAVEISMDLLDFGWDKKYGGIFYFMDVKGNPPQQLEWDQKLWWVHQESIIATLKGYMFTKDERCWDWFEKIHDYAWNHFSDSQYGEWFGYLNRRGEVLLNLKGGKWKGCFHTPRFLKESWMTLSIINKNLSNES